MNTHHQHGRFVKPVKHTGRWIFAAVVGAILVVGLVLVGLHQGAQPTETSNQTTANTQPSGHFMDPHELRSVKVAPADAPMVLDAGGATVATVTLLEGTIPPGATTATVKTDENCAPDESGPTKGWSHCHNRVEFTDGTVAVVQHHHMIAKVGCFTPGQTIKFV